MHADHTSGLTSSWHSYTIYCSEVTRKLVIAKLGVKGELVVGLPLDEPVTINLDEVGEETMTVTLIDANHCPGSVMFVFEGYFGKILYTGDFRFCERFLTHSAIVGKQFDIVYLDNTYCNPRCFFPSRSCATITIMAIIRNHPEHKIVIGLHSLGKEVLLHTIAVACKTWIGVDPLRREMLELLGMPDVFTCDVDRTRIRVVKSVEINRRNIELWNMKEPTIAILPTCLYVGTCNPYKHVPNVYVVPYSDHSSFEELKKFVQSIRPRKIIPIVHKHRLSAGEDVDSRLNMNVFQHLMDSSPSLPYTVPHSVECFMTAEIMPATKKRAKATKQVCLRKVAKRKKPCGVVFPPSLDADEVMEKDVDLAGSDSDGKAKMSCELGDVMHGMVMEVNSEDKKTVTEAFLFTKKDSNLGGIVKVGNIDVAQDTNDGQNTHLSCVSTDSDLGERINLGNYKDDKDLDMVQETKDEENAIASGMEMDTDSERKAKIIGGDDNNPEMPQETGNAVASCIETDDMQGQSGTIPEENISVNVKNVGDLSGHKDSSGTGVDEQKVSIKKKYFNIYTGCSCDFARTFLEDMAKSGAI